MPDSASTCEVCESRIDEHTCRLGTDVGQRTGGRIARLLGLATFSAELWDKRGTVWICEHSHQSPGSALACARSQLRRLQNTASELSQLPRPRMIQVVESVAAHAPVPGLTNPAWEALKALFRNRCRYCGITGPLERDHRIPMSRNGQNRIRNIVSACPRCNRAKGTATEDEYLAALRRLWGRRVPRTIARLDEQLTALEGRYQHRGTEERRAVTLLRSLRIPLEMWITRPDEAHQAIHRGKQHAIAGVSFRLEVIRRILGKRNSWEGNVTLVPQPSNPSDSNAVAIFHPLGQIGFLPAPIASEVSRDLLDALQEGYAVAARCVLYRTKRGIGGRVKLDLPLQTRLP